MLIVMLVFANIFSCNKPSDEEQQLLKSAPQGNELAVEQASLHLYDQTRRGGYRLIFAQELKNRLDKNEQFLIIDTRSAKLYKAAHIINAINISTPIAQEGPEIAAYQKIITPLLPADKLTPLLFYASSVLDPRSHTAAQLAISLGYRYVYRMAGGFSTWKELNLPIK